MAYQYRPIKQAQPGDVIEYQRTSNYPLDNADRVGKNCLVPLIRVEEYNKLYFTNRRGNEDWMAGHGTWKLLKTKPGSEAKVGDTIICIEWSGSSHHVGETLVVTPVNLYATITAGKWLVLCEADGILTSTGATASYTHDDMPDSFCYLALEPDIKLTNQKETTMNSDKLAKAIIDVCTPEVKTVKVKTDLQKRKKFSGVIYTTSGKYNTTVYSNSEKKLRKLMQLPHNLGMTMVTHEAKSVITTNIPVVTTKA